MEDGFVRTVVIRNNYSKLYMIIQAVQLHNMNLAASN